MSSAAGWQLTGDEEQVIGHRLQVTGDEGQLRTDN